MTSIYMHDFVDNQPTHVIRALRQRAWLGQKDARRGDRGAASATGLWAALGHVTAPPSL